MKNKPWQLLIAILLIASIGSIGDELKGPLIDAFGSPFIIAYPSKMSEEVPMWGETLDAFIKSLPSQKTESVKREDQLTQDDFKNNNIVLFTLFRDSSILQQIRQNLPIRIGADEIVLNKHIYRGDVGLIFVIPNPLNPNKYLAVFGATTPQALSHIMDFKDCYDDPVDYMLFTVEENGPALKTEAGIFDKEGGRWKLYPATIPWQKARWESSPAKQFLKYGTITLAEFVMYLFPQDALIIYGSSSSDSEENEHTKEQALLKQKIFAERVYTKIRVKADRDVSEEELKGNHIILMGTPACNSILAKIRDKLPIKFSGKFIIARFPYTGRWTGVTFACPNPLNQENFLVVYSGVSYEGFFHSAWAGNNDYVIYRNSPIGPHGESADIILEMGLFDKSDPRNWKIKR